MPPRLDYSGKRFLKDPNSMRKPLSLRTYAALLAVAFLLSACTSEEESVVNGSMQYVTFIYSNQDTTSRLFLRLHDREEPSCLEATLAKSASRRVDMTIFLDSLRTEELHPGLVRNSLAAIEWLEEPGAEEDLSDVRMTRAEVSITRVTAGHIHGGVRLFEPYLATPDSVPSRPGIRFKALRCPDFTLFADSVASPAGLPQAYTPRKK